MNAIQRFLLYALFAATLSPKVYAQTSQDSSKQESSLELSIEESWKLGEEKIIEFLKKNVTLDDSKKNRECSMDRYDTTLVGKFPIKGDETFYSVRLIYQEISQGDKIVKSLSILGSLKEDLEINTKGKGRLEKASIITNLVMNHKLLRSSLVLFESPGIDSFYADDGRYLYDSMRVNNIVEDNPCNAFTLYKNLGKYIKSLKTNESGKPTPYYMAVQNHFLN